MKNKALKNTLSVIAVLLVFAIVLTFATMILKPKYMTNLIEGSMIDQYYREDKYHDVIFIGDCGVYTNFNPMEMYREEGITAYVRGSSQQLIWQSYYILKETFEHETPKVVVFDVNNMRYSEPVSEAYNRLAIDNMKWSDEKVGIINASMMEEETFLSYVFPILRYHSRFDELTGEDFEYLFKTKDNTWNGHIINKGVDPLVSLPTMRPLADYNFSEICWGYLDKMRELCEENGAEFILVKVPSVYPFWYDEYDAQIKEYVAQHGMKFYNFLECVDEIGINYDTDTYDAGLHLNLDGARKLSVYFAKILAENHGLSDRRDDAEVAVIYDEKLRLYDIAAAN